MSQHECVLLLGSNLGNKKENINLALKKLEEANCKILNKTNFLNTKPIEFVSCNNFCNIATSIVILFSPIKLLKIIKVIEKEMGRDLDSKDLGGYNDRIIDIDIVTFGSIHFSSDKLIIPHTKHENEREFSKKLLLELEILNKKHNK